MDRTDFYKEIGNGIAVERTELTFTDPDQIDDLRVCLEATRDIVSHSRPLGGRSICRVSLARVETLIAELDNPKRVMPNGTIAGEKPDGS
jgi:hypothetical protein